MKREYVVGAGVLLAVVAALLWWLWPASTEVDPGRSDGVADTRSKSPERKVTKFVSAEERAEAAMLPLEEDPNIPVVTKTCKWIVTDERRNVPQWVMLDNLRDRGQKFVEDDIRCLTAAGVTPAILDFAERYQDQNKLQGKVGAPRTP
ncbi:MAG: hypothetical protein R3F61_01095 [Myxococcota bacterium]